MADTQLDLDFEIPVREAGTGQIKRVTFGAASVAKIVSPDALADEVVRRATPSFPPDLQKRFRESVLARINDVRDAIETREELVRTPEKGGLGMPAADADRALKIIDEVMKGVSPKPAPPAPPIPVTLRRAPSQSDGKASPPSPSTPAPKPPEAVPPIPRDEVYEKLAEEVIGEIGISLPPDIRRRLVIALVARLKDVRDSAETKDYITRPVPAGGVGLQAAQAERVLSLVNLRFSKITEEMDRVERERTLTALKREREGEERRVEIRQAGEGMARDELFAAITAKSKKMPQAPTPSVSPPPLTSPTPPPPARLAAPPAPSLRPKVLDVPPAVKLVGPVEELRAMTLADFRKLARDPKEACLKIRDKINLLQEESFEKRNAAVTAWRGSEPMRIYAELTAAALQEGKAVPVQIQERTAAGKPSLTQEEFTAIMELNRILRF